MTELKIVIFLCLFLGFTGMFYLLNKSRILRKKLQEAYESLDNASLHREREHKRNLALFETRIGIINRIRKRFIYSGLGRIFTFLNPELWLIIRILAAASIYFISNLLGNNWIYGFVSAIILSLVLHLTESLLIHRNYKAVDKNLLEFLNILGNYSITAGEVTGILNQVSRYMQEPLKSALDECYHEALTSGNTDMALLTLSDKIEHPKFKEVIKSIEICARYSADFTIVVRSSRRIIQDYMKACQERKGLAQESMVNMFILSIMLFVVLIVVDQMLEVSIWSILFQTLIGQIVVVVVIALLIAFYWQIATTDR